MAIPGKIKGAAAWYGKDFRGKDLWVYRFTDPDIEELLVAVAKAKNSGSSIANLTKADFPLPKLSEIFESIRQEILEGRGFCLLKGLPVFELAREEVIILYWGIGLYFGDAVPQNAKGHLLGHVKNLGNDPFDPMTRIYTTNYLQPYHTDSCDIVGLLCLRTAKSGGMSSFSSSTTIYNEMLDLDPELVKVLMQDFYVDRKGEVPEGKLPHYQMAVFHYFKGYLNTIYARDFIEAAQKNHPDIPRLSDQQIRALDAFDALASREDIRLDMELEAGDLQLLHNHQIVHSRTSYEDHEAIHLRRHLLRLWLSAIDGRELPAVFAERYGNFYGPKRGGIYVEGMTYKVPLEAE